MTVLSSAGEKETAWNLWHGYRSQSEKPAWAPYCTEKNIFRHGLHGLTRLFYVIIALKPWNPCNPCLNIFFSDSFWIDFRHKNKRTYFLHSFYSKFVLWGLCLKKESLVHISTVWSSNRVSGLPPFTFSFPPQKKEKTDECLLHRTQVIIEETLE